MGNGLKAIELSDNAIELKNTTGCGRFTKKTCMQPS
jgi:hypothetical protein